MSRFKVRLGFDGGSGIDGCLMRRWIEWLSPTRAATHSSRYHSPLDNHGPLSSPILEHRTPTLSDGDRRRIASGQYATGLRYRLRRRYLVCRGYFSVDTGEQRRICHSGGAELDHLQRDYCHQSTRSPQVRIRSNGRSQTGNIGYATITFGNADGQLTTQVMPVFLYYLITDNATGNPEPVPIQRGWFGVNSGPGLIT